MPPDTGAAGLKEMADRRVETVVIRTDGAARGNPGPAGIGVLIADEAGEVLEESSDYIGVATNNVAEYAGLIDALKKAARYGADTAEIYLDSELLVKQLQGVYKVKNAALRSLHGSVQELLAGYRRVRIEHVPRERNVEADKLANEAIDRFEAGEIAVKKVSGLPEQGSLF